MKDPLEKTKVVIRHLPPTLSQSDLFQQIDERFSSRYSWFSFRPGNYSQKRQKYSRAYIEFNHPDDVFEFAEFFDGHVFVNEKGVQHKAIVEYAPSQRVPKPFVKKDAREGTILKGGNPVCYNYIKLIDCVQSLICICLFSELVNAISLVKLDPDYHEFLKLIAKPTEHLPSAEIQLERKEAEHSGLSKDTPIITPLMEYVRQKRAVGSGNLASSIMAKVSRRSQAASPGKTLSTNSKRGYEKKKFIQKDNKARQKENSTFILVPRREDQSVTASTKPISESETGIPLTDDFGKKKILLLKGKEREIPHGSDTSSQQRIVHSAGSSRYSTASKQNPRREAGGRLIRSILLNNEPRQSQSGSASNKKIQILSGENGNRPPRPGNLGSASNGLISNQDVSSTTSEGGAKRASDGRYVKKELQGSDIIGDKLEKHTRNKDRPDRGVWTPRRSDVSHSISENLSSTSQSTQSHSDSIEVSNVELKDDILFGSQARELSASFTGRNTSTENGSHRHFGRRGDGGPIVSEGKSSRRGAAGRGAHEKHVWVKKTPPGS